MDTSDKFDELDTDCTTVTGDELCALHDWLHFEIHFNDLQEKWLHHPRLMYFQLRRMYPPIDYMKLPGPSKFDKDVGTLMWGLEVWRKAVHKLLLLIEKMEWRIDHLEEWKWDEPDWTVNPEP